jgi:hypothetical protein
MQIRFTLVNKKRYPFITFSDRIVVTDKTPVLINSLTSARNGRRLRNEPLHDGTTSVS